MNPSANGWVSKYCREIDSGVLKLPDPDSLYNSLRTSGFIYGTTVSTIITTDQRITLSEEEKTKINLFTALCGIYYDTIENGNSEDLVAALIEFYTFLDTKKSLFSLLTNRSGKPKEKLEKIIHHRIQTTESIIKKNFSHLITNALLFLDVLAFEHFLLHEENPIDYASQMEDVMVKTVLLALHSKLEKNQSDELLIHLFASSVRYATLYDEKDLQLQSIDFTFFKDDIEKKYVLDLSSLALWTDKILDPKENIFITSLGEELGVSKTWVTQSVQHVDHFIGKYKDQISYFNYSNPAHHFYKQTSRTVHILILRNKKRLLTEITESKDLVILLGQSTIRDLTKDERKKVKQQLLDICKSIPSLAIFILPGGGLLLPLLIKFIPKLLPSAFNENV